MVSRLKMLPVSLLLAGLAGCASVPADWGRADVGQMTAERGRALPQVPDAKAFTDQALRAPLTADTAVQLALINNPVVRREAARLGFAAAEVYDAGRLANPTFSLTRLVGDSSAGANVPQLTLGIAFNFVNLLFLPANNRYAQGQFEAAKLSVGAAALDLAAEVEAAWYMAVGADQLAQMRGAAAKAQRASVELGQRFFDAGNISRRELAMEQAAASQATLAEISARAEAVGARSQLNRLMGLNADQNAWPLDARLAEPLPQEDDVKELQRLSLDGRLDVASARRRAQTIADRFGFTRRTRFINGVQIGAERERDYDGSLNAGPTLELELPLFNWGGGRVAAITAALNQAEAELDERVLDASNEVQLGAARVGAARALAEQYRSALIPQREAIVARAQEEQNYMLIGIFEVILAKQQEYDAYAGYIEAVRDYWTARAELSRAVGRRLPSSEQAAKPTLDPVEVLRPKGGGMDHSKMGGMSKDMKGMDMEGKEGVKGEEGMGGMEGMDHKGMPGMDQKGTEGRDKKAMPGMDNKGMGGMDREGMPGMDMENEAGPDCSAMKGMDLSKVDPSVAKAMQEQCKGAGKSGDTAPAAAPTKPDPHADHDMGDMPMKGMDHDKPDSKKPPQKPEAPHAH